MMVTVKRDVPNERRFRRGDIVESRMTGMIGIVTSEQDKTGRFSVLVIGEALEAGYMSLYTESNLLVKGFKLFSGTLELRNEE